MPVKVPFHSIPNTGRLGRGGQHAATENRPVIYILKMKRGNFLLLVNI